MSQASGTGDRLGERQAGETERLAGEAPRVGGGRRRDDGGDTWIGGAAARSAPIPPIEWPSDRPDRDLRPRNQRLERRERVGPELAGA